jgi:hypothetical protein
VADCVARELTDTSVALAKPQASERTRADNSAVRMYVVIVDLHGGLVASKRPRAGPTMVPLIFAHKKAL